MFGWRMMNGLRKRQSYCRDCRSGKKTRALAQAPETATATKTLRDFLPSIWNLKIWGGMDMTQVPLKIRHRSNYRGSRGFARYMGPLGTVHMTISAEGSTPLTDQVITLIHEYVHIWFYRTSLGLRGEGKFDEAKEFFREHHGKRFLAMELAAYEEWLGAPLVVLDIDHKWGKRSTRIYHQWKAACRMAKGQTAVAV